MRALQLDFLQKHSRRNWASWALAVMSLAFAFDVGRSWYALRGQIADREARLLIRTKAPPDRHLIKASVRPVQDGELVAARDTIRRLSVPWNGLFDALESAQTDRSSLLSIEPDMANRAVVLTGEAANYLAVLSYVANLETQKFFSYAYLAKHEMRAKDPHRPVAFTISATWRERE